MPKILTIRKTYRVTINKNIVFKWGVYVANVKIMLKFKNIVAEVKRVCIFAQN